MDFDLIIPATVCILVAIIAWISLSKIVKTMRRRSFSKQYQIGKLPKSVVVKKAAGKSHNYYVLKYPYWKASKKDQTADRRFRYNCIIWQKSTLWVETYELVSLRPYDLIWTVKLLRSHGVNIDLCQEEQRKRDALIKKCDAFSYGQNLEKLTQYYAETPTEFEGLCADLFSRMGYTAKLTPPTNDGGYDILLQKGEEKTIVECKCYSPQHKIGRPAIQKLVGANMVVLAEKMIFITTSDFSTAATSYADSIGLVLINGCKLLDLLEKQGFLKRERTEISPHECQLNVADTSPYVPEDIYKKYFWGHV